LKVNNLRARKEGTKMKNVKHPLLYADHIEAEFRRARRQRALFRLSVALVAGFVMFVLMNALLWSSNGIIGAVDVIPAVMVVEEVSGHGEGWMI
jgi:hypothetical protein